MPDTFFLSFKIFIFMCMDILPVYMSGQHICVVLAEARKRYGIPWN